MPYDKLTGHQKMKLEKEKKKYADYLLDQCENYVFKRRYRMREKLIAEIYEASGLNVQFQKKNMYLEERIEANQKYFGFMNDLNYSGADMMQIRKDLFKVNRTIEMNKIKNPHKVDPCSLLRKKSTKLDSHHKTHI